uniref:Uncharacterized protein n=1 Tax=Marseillevirus LCMAC202 TaxID=2506606 RepID=A0A481YYG0_9VIRU|nr:MAG: hypothetical protein LCMAC202_02380 [Marseillevirus LCMAC202]
MSSLAIKTPNEMAKMAEMIERHRDEIVKMERRHWAEIVKFVDNDGFTEALNKMCQLTLKDIGMPDINLESYLNENIYESLLQQIRFMGRGKPEYSFSAFESYEQIYYVYKATSPIEAGFQYLLETSFPGFYDEIYDLFEENEDLTIGGVINYIKEVFSDQVRYLG